MNQSFNESDCSIVTNIEKEENWFFPSLMLAMVFVVPATQEAKGGGSLNPVVWEQPEKYNQIPSEKEHLGVVDDNL
jgi:hypothetical protein